ncbi:MAG TPA: membrane dipeptidase [Anaerolineae bacterium]|nr:membrane dipeptidase [Anaerolineae bacterium]
MPTHHHNPHPLIIDGHNDTVLRFYGAELLGIELPSFFEKNSVTHIDLPRARAGGLGGGFFAMYTPNEVKWPDEDAEPGAGEDESAETNYQTPLPPMVDHNFALKVTFGMMRKLLAWEKESDGQIKIVRNSAELAHCLKNGIFGIIMHIEGAEAIDENFDSLHIFHQVGLRSIGPVWSRPTIFGHGVPFNFPDTPDIGDGLTDLGKQLIRECNQLNILVDLSHLNLKGFRDVAAISTAPLVCTHSGAHAMAASPRNLLDEQLDAIKATNGVTGINYHVPFLRQDGRRTIKTSVTEIVRHVAYVADRIGVEHVALGSDFDGAKMPDDLVDVAGQPRIIAALHAHGFNEVEISKIAHGNWLRVLSDTWGS